MADNISTVVKGFGCLCEDFDEDFFSQIVREYAVSLLSMSIERYPQALTTDPADALSMLAHPLAADYSPFWCPELAHSLAALKSDDPAKAARGIGQILLNLSCSGVPGSWGISLEKPSRFNWDQYLTPQAQAVEVQSDGTTAQITARSDDDNRRTLTLHAADHAADHIADATPRWHCPDGETIPHLPMRKFPLLLLTKGLLEQFELPPCESPALDEIESVHVESVSSCLSFLRENFPSYCSWVERVLRYLCLVQSPPGTMHSGSFEGHFGFAFVTARNDPVKMAEMLIHECSHQYFSLLTRFEALTDDDDGRLYYSPFVRRERPADRIMLAYHAFANVEIFYRACVRAGISVSRCQSAIEQLRPDLEIVERSLVQDIRFTPVGRCVMDSLLAHRSSYELTN
jgi:hypothetical protein